MHPDLHLGFELAGTEDLRLTAEQQEAVDLLLPAIKARKVCALRGAAVTGKSFTVSRLLDLLEKEGLVPLLCAPTNKACGVLRRFTEGLAEVKTLASLLKISPTFDETKGEVVFQMRTDDWALRSIQRRGQLPSVIVLDEASMVDQASCLQLKALAEGINAALLLVGDPSQLPPVGDDDNDEPLQMAELFLDPPVGATLTTVVRHAGPILQLATAIRGSEYPAPVWPISSIGAAGSDSRVVLHHHRGRWARAAAALICTEEWDANPDRARVLCWSNRAATAIGQELRVQRFGAAEAGRWHVGEIVSTPRGFGVEGDALGDVQAYACTEHRIVKLSEVVRLEQLLATIPWATPAKQLARELEISAGVDAVRAEVEDTETGASAEIWLEASPGGSQWSAQCTALKAKAKAHLSGSKQRKAYRAIADLRTFVPLARQAASLTVHASQGSSFGSMFLYNDISRSDDPATARALSYVGATRPQQELHVLPWICQEAA